MFMRCFTFEPLKTVKGFKHIHIKSSSEVLKENQKLPGEILKFRCKILSETLNCNSLTAREILVKNGNVIDFNYNSFYQNAKFINEYLKCSDLVEYPCLLTLQPNVLQHRYFSLRELGFCNVTPNYILRFVDILKETPQSIKQKGFPFTCEYKSNILSESLSVSKRTEIHNKLQHMYKDGSNLQKIREVMNAEFLSAKLGCSIGKAHQILHKCASLRIQSISITDQLLNLLLFKYGLPLSKVNSSFHLLSMHHEAPEQLLSEFPEILDVSTLFLVQRLPLLLKQEIDTIYKIEAVLKNFDISKDQLICCPKVLLISPNTLQKRLNALCNSEDFAVLKSNKKFLWLVHYYSNLKSRLKHVKAENMPCSINMFTSSKNVFEKNLLYNNSRTCIREAYVYLGDVFKRSEKDIFRRLRHCSHLRSENQNFSTQNCRKVIEFLLLSGITKEQIFNGLEIVFYDIDIVNTYFKNMKTHPQCQPYNEWISHSNLIQLLIYTIEVTEYQSYEEEKSSENIETYEICNNICTCEENRYLENAN